MTIIRPARVVLNPSPDDPVRVCWMEVQQLHAVHVGRNHCILMVRQAAHVGRVKELVHIGDQVCTIGCEGVVVERKDGFVGEEAVPCDCTQATRIASALKPLTIFFL